MLPRYHSGRVRELNRHGAITKKVIGMARHKINDEALKRLRASAQHLHCLTEALNFMGMAVQWLGHATQCPPRGDAGNKELIETMNRLDEKFDKVQERLDWLDKNLYDVEELTKP